MKRLYAGSTIAAVLSLLSACGKHPGTAQAGGPSVATVGTSQISADQFKAKLGELPPMIQSRYATLERKKEFLNNLVRNEVLLAEAKSRGLDKDPEVRATLDRVLVQRLLKLEGEQFEKNNVPSEEELKAFYEGHTNEFVRPERIRVSHVFFNAGSARERVKAEAEKSLADVKSKESGANRTAFGALARARSDDERTKALEGDLGFRTREELAGLWGQALADAAFSLKEPNDIGTVLATERGFHLIKLTGRQPGFEQKFDSVKTRIQTRLTLEKKSKYTEEFVNQLKQKANVTIHEDVLGSIEVAQNPAPSAPQGILGAPPSPSAPQGAARHDLEPGRAAAQPAAPSPSPAAQAGRP